MSTIQASSETDSAKPYTVPRILWTGLLLVQFLLISVAYYNLYVSQERTTGEVPDGSLRVILTISGIFAISCGYFLTKYLVKGVKVAHSRHILIPVILRVAMAMSITVYGLMLALAYGNILEMVPLTTLALIFMAFNFPGPSLMRRLFGSRYQP